MDIFCTIPESFSLALAGDGYIYIDRNGTNSDKLNTDVGALTRGIYTLPTPYSSTRTLVADLASSITYIGPATYGSGTDTIYQIELSSGLTRTKTVPTYYVYNTNYIMTGCYNSTSKTALHHNTGAFPNILTFFNATTATVNQYIPSWLSTQTPTHYQALQLADSCPLTTNGNFLVLAASYNDPSGSVYAGTVVFETDSAANQIGSSWVINEVGNFISYGDFLFNSGTGNLYQISTKTHVQTIANGAISNMVENQFLLSNTTGTYIATFSSVGLSLEYQVADNSGSIGLGRDYFFVGSNVYKRAAIEDAYVNNIKSGIPVAARVIRLYDNGSSTSVTLDENFSAGVFNRPTQSGSYIELSILDDDEVTLRRLEL